VRVVPGGHFVPEAPRELASALSSFLSQDGDDGNRIALRSEVRQ
jgi:hypothetical protein